MERSEEIEKLLDQPATSILGGNEANPLDSLRDDLGVNKQEEKPEEDAQVSSAPEKAAVPPKEENRVPYSRFEKMRERAEEAERRSAEDAGLRTRLAALEEQARRPRIDKDVELPNYWTKLYGDSDTSREAYVADQELRQTERERMLSEIREEMQSNRTRETELIQQNSEAIDDMFDEFESEVKRTLTDDEKADLLEIIDEYTPTGKDGRYIEGAEMPIEKAYEIFELRSNQRKYPKRQARNQVAALSSASSEGESSSEASNDDTAPPRWGSWRSKFGG